MFANTGNMLFDYSQSQSQSFTDGSSYTMSFDDETTDDDATNGTFSTGTYTSASYSTYGSTQSPTPSDVSSLKPIDLIPSRRQPSLSKKPDKKGGLRQTSPKKERKISSSSTSPTKKQNTESPKKPQPMSIQPTKRSTANKSVKAATNVVTSEPKPKVAEEQLKLEHDDAKARIKAIEASRKNKKDADAVPPPTKKAAATTPTTSKPTISPTSSPKMTVKKTLAAAKVDSPKRTSNEAQQKIMTSTSDNIKKTTPPASLPVATSQSKQTTVAAATKTTTTASVEKKTKKEARGKNREKNISSVSRSKTGTTKVLAIPKTTPSAAAAMPSPAKVLSRNETENTSNTDFEMVKCSSTATATISNKTRTGKAGSEPIPQVVPTTVGAPKESTVKSSNTKKTMKVTSPTNLTAVAGSGSGSGSAPAPDNVKMIAPQPITVSARKDKAPKVVPKAATKAVAPVKETGANVVLPKSTTTSASETKEDTENKAVSPPDASVFSPPETSASIKESPKASTGTDKPPVVSPSNASASTKESPEANTKTDKPKSKESKAPKAVGTPDAMKAPPTKKTSKMTPHAASEAFAKSSKTLDERSTSLLGRFWRSRSRDIASRNVDAEQLEQLDRLVASTESQDSSPTPDELVEEDSPKLIVDAPPSDSPKVSDKAMLSPMHSVTPVPNNTIGSTIEGKAQVTMPNVASGDAEAFEVISPSNASKESVPAIRSAQPQSRINSTKITKSKTDNVVKKNKKQPTNRVAQSTSKAGPVPQTSTSSHTATDAAKIPNKSGPTTKKSQVIYFVEVDSNNIAPPEHKSFEAIGSPEEIVEDVDYPSGCIARPQDAETKSSGPTPVKATLHAVSVKESTSSPEQKKLKKKSQKVVESLSPKKLLKHRSKASVSKIQEEIPDFAEVSPLQKWAFSVGGMGVEVLEPMAEHQQSSTPDSTPALTCKVQSTTVTTNLSNVEITSVEIMEQANMSSSATKCKKDDDVPSALSIETHVKASAPGDNMMKKSLEASQPLKKVTSVPVFGGSNKACATIRMARSTSKSKATPPKNGGDDRAASLKLTRSTRKTKSTPPKKKGGIIGSSAIKMVRGTSKTKQSSKPVLPSLPRESIDPSKGVGSFDTANIRKIPATKLARSPGSAPVAPLQASESVSSLPGKPSARARRDMVPIAKNGFSPKIPTPPSKAIQRAAPAAQNKSNTTVVAVPTVKEVTSKESPSHASEEDKPSYSDKDISTPVDKSMSVGNLENEAQISMSQGSRKSIFNYLWPNVAVSSQMFKPPSEASPEEQEKIIPTPEIVYVPALVPAIVAVSSADGTIFSADETVDEEETSGDTSKLGIGIDRFSSDAFEMILDTLKASKAVTTLELCRTAEASMVGDNSRRTVDEVQELFDAVLSLSDLKELRLWDFGPFNDAKGGELDAVCGLLNSLPSLEVLGLGVPTGTLPDRLLETIGKSLPNLKVAYLKFHTSCNLSKLLGKSCNLQQLHIIEDYQSFTATGEKANNSDAVDLDGRLQYTSGHCLSMIQSLNTAKQLRVLDLGVHLGLPAFCVKILANTLRDSNNKLTSLSFTYGRDDVFDVDFWDTVAMNNGIVEAFCNVIDSNSTLKYIKNHASSEVWIESQYFNTMQHAINCSPVKLFDLCNTKTAEDLEEEQQRSGLFGCVADVTCGA